MDATASHPPDLRYSKLHFILESAFCANDITFAQLNPFRPNLILNSTRGSWSNHDGEGIPFGDPFTFTAEDFGEIDSSIASYSVARAVMASATFPGAFNFMTLEDFKNGGYLHVFDGGNSDNLGLTSLKRVIWGAIFNPESDAPKLKAKKIIVILVDAYTKPKGANSNDSDPRSGISYVIDTNFLDATDSLLAKNRKALLAQYEIGELFPYGGKQVSAALTETAPDCMSTNNGRCTVISNKIKSTHFEQCTEFFHWFPKNQREAICNKDGAWWNSLNQEIHSKLQFIHLSFEDVGGFRRISAKPTGDFTAVDYIEFSKQKGRWVEPKPSVLLDQLNSIPTSFKFNSRKNGESQLEDDEVLACAVPTLFGKNNICTNKNGQVVGTAQTRDVHAGDFKNAKEILEHPERPLEK